QKVAAKIRLSKVRVPTRQALDHDDLVARLERLGDVVGLLADADPERKARIYAGLASNSSTTWERKRSWSDRTSTRTP
ncbi:MAG: hypothetical protein ACJ72W_20365, partial [Actinoallomurus sp.]